MFHVKQNLMSNLTLRQPLLLGGFMGTGKSTVGPIVATQANVPFCDLDAVIEQATGSSIAAIFATSGEAAFRHLEATTLRRLLADPVPSVIALGGGTLVDPSLRAEVLPHTHVVNLVAHAHTIADRVGTSSRPLLAGAHNPKQRIHELLSARAQAYAHAHALIRTDDRSPEDIANAVLHAWTNQTLLVHTSSLTYPATLTRNAPRTLIELVRTLDPSSTFVVTDQNVDKLHVEPFLENPPKPPLGKVVLTPGEVHKQWPAVQQILEAAIQAGADRNTLLIAIGGGVVSDITGFAAAILLRGVRWVAIPTTLLSMVDAAVGGKTAVDLGLAKNAVGAFHQPSGVIIDPRFTHTESSRAYISGLAEVIKSGAIADPDLLDLMLADPSAVLSRDIPTIEQLVLRALRVKTTIVSRDERESGERMLLNFGHTIGHGLEAAGNYAELTHGEAVALGMIAILRFGQAQGVTPDTVVNRIEHLLQMMGLPTNLDDQPLERALDLMAFDKKRLGSTLRLVLLEEMGRARVAPTPMEKVRTFFRR